MSESDLQKRNTVEIVEVAPRDGFQSIKKPIPTRKKVEIIERLFAAGYRRIEIGSFVNPRAVPQMADMKLLAEAFSGREGSRPAALVPNRKGAELAIEHGIPEIVYVFSASERHNQANVRQSVAQSIEQLSELVALGAGDGTLRLRVDLATSFDCPYQGAIAFESVRNAVEAIIDRCPTVEVALCDTTGRANPYEVRDRFSRLMTEFDDPGTQWAFHGHDTFGMGVANALFAHEAGVRVFDVSAAGLGGCPFAPGATGNTASEDLLFAFEEGGIRTGVDLGALLDVADEITRLPEACTGGHLRHVPRSRVLTEPDAGPVR